MKRKNTIIILAVLAVLLCASLSACGLRKAHTHTFSEDWTTDAEYHWHAATCKHTGEVADKAAHSWNDGVTTTEPTITESGVRTFTCTVCGKTRTEAIPVLQATDGTAAFADGYNPSKVYDASAAAAPEAGDYITNNSGGHVTVEWYLGETLLDYAPVDVGEYTVKITVAAYGSFTEATASKDFAISQKEIQTLNLKRFYDGGTAFTEITASAPSDVFEADTELVNFSLTVSAKTVNTYTVSASGVTIGGAKRLNYKLASAANISAVITQKPLTDMVLQKTYDRTNVFTIANLVSVQGFVEGDDVTGNVVVGDANVGGYKTVTEITLGGADGDNYYIETYAISAHIIEKSLQNVVLERIYDGTQLMYATLTAANGVIDGDEITCTITLNDKNAGSKTATDVMLSGSSWGNYLLGLANITATITKKELTNVRLKKVYDGTAIFTEANITEMTGVIEGDELTGTITVNSAEVGSKNIINAEFGGADENNYSLVLTDIVELTIAYSATLNVILGNEAAYNDLCPGFVPDPRLSFTNTGSVQVSGITPAVVWQQLVGNDFVDLTEKPSSPITPGKYRFTVNVTATGNHAAAAEYEKIFTVDDTHNFNYKGECVYDGCAENVGQSLNNEGNAISASFEAEKTYYFNYTAPTAGTYGFVMSSAFGTFVVYDGNGAAVEVNNGSFEAQADSTYYIVLTCTETAAAGNVSIVLPQ